jgi:DNA integrity scanning protein DisA with diadenylate cyclase activity
MRNEPVGTLTERPPGPISRVVGLYQTFLRRILEHFFPDAVLDIESDRSFINWDGSPQDEHYGVSDDPDGFGVRIDWFRTRYVFQHASPTPFLPAERRLIEIILRSLDLRFRGLFDADLAHRLERSQYTLEDVILTEYLAPPDPYRVTAALESLRVAALSTYENRRVSMGALLLGTLADPLMPAWANPEGAPRFNARLTSIKGFHRLSDGVKTVCLIDRQGDLMRLVDIERWADLAQGAAPIDVPCPQAYTHHAKATRSGGHVCLVLTPAQEIKVFAEGTLAFAFSDARWRLLDISTKYASWCTAVGNVCAGTLAPKLFQAALNLSEDRRGALFVVLRDPAASIPQLIAPPDRIIEEVVADDPHDPDNLSPRLAKRALHHAVRGQSLIELDPAVVEAVANIDGAVVTDLDGRLLTFGAILRIGPDAHKVPRAIEGARTLAAMAASYHGPVLKVSEDGFVTMFLGGRRVWEM